MELNTNARRMSLMSHLLHSAGATMGHNCYNFPCKSQIGSPGRTSVQLSSDGHSLGHSGNGIREWSGNRCVFAIPREFPFLFPFPQNFLRGGGSITPITIFQPNKTSNGTGGPLTQCLKLGVTVVRGGRGGVLVHQYFLLKTGSFWRDLHI